MKRLAAISIVLLTLVLGACSGETEPAAGDGDAVHPGQSTPSAPAAAAAVTADATGCEPGLSIEEQKQRLVAIANRQFSGSTAHDPELPRLHYDPDARERREGGIWVVVEFNGDEFDTVAEKKATLDRQMSDAYEGMFTAGCEDLAQIDLTARAMAVASGGQGSGAVFQTLATVFKTRLKREVADNVDWSSKDLLDFNEIWETLLLNVRWQRELKGD